jgi:hypothetical protein
MVTGVRKEGVKPADEYDRSAFVNCPFSPDYQGLFRAIVFTIYICEFRPRCALEVSDSSENRLSKIQDIVEECRFGIHDLSIMGLDEATRLPRFNMPFELGLFIAAKRFGGAKQKRKVALVLDTDPYRYRAALSDISGQDIASHQGSPELAITRIRDWLDASDRARGSLVGGDFIVQQYKAFSERLPNACEEQRLNPEKLTFADLCRAIEAWLADNA